MNRSVLAAASAAAAPLAVFAIARYARRFAPVAIGEVPLETNGFSAHIQASGDMISVVSELHARAPLETAHFRASSGALLPRRGLPAGVGEWTGQISEADERCGQPRRIALNDGAGATLLLDVPAEFDGPAREFGRVSLAPGMRAQLVRGKDYLCWPLDAPPAPDALPMPASCGPPIAPQHLKLAHPCWVCVFAPDGESAVTSNTVEIRRLALQTGEMSAPTPLEGQQNTNHWGLSPQGNFHVANSFDAQKFDKIDPFDYEKRRAVKVVWNVHDTHTGRLLWRFLLEVNVRERAIAPDESVIALPFPSRAQWDIRDLQTGQKLRTLPLVPNLKSAAFSPDAKTLYSLAGGVLYRQRAR